MCCLVAFAGIFTPCPRPPHKRELDCLLADTSIDRSVPHLLGYQQQYTRVRQVVGTSATVKVKATVYRSTTEEEDEEEELTSDSVSEYYPEGDMSSRGPDVIDSEVEARMAARQATLDKRAKASRARYASKRKAGTGSSGAASPCVTNDDVFVVPAPIPPISRSKGHKTPTSYDVDKCARWTVPSHVSDAARGQLEGLPKLPRPRNSQSFGVLGTGPDYARDVVAPYMSFEGDAAMLEKESSSANSDTMLEYATAVSRK